MCTPQPVRQSFQLLRGYHYWVKLDTMIEHALVNGYVRIIVGVVTVLKQSIHQRFINARTSVSAFCSATKYSGLEGDRCLGWTFIIGGRWIAAAFMSDKNHITFAVDCAHRLLEGRRRQSYDLTVFPSSGFEWYQEDGGWWKERLCKEMNGWNRQEFGYRFRFVIMFAQIQIPKVLVLVPPGL